MPVPGSLDLCFIASVPLDDVISVLVQLLDAHTFEWLGRADFVINSGGVKVAAEKVELVLDVALAELGAARRCFVAGLPDERLGQAVTAFIEGKPLEPIMDSKSNVL